MVEILTIDVGHLVNDEDSENFLSQSAFRSIDERYGSPFDEIRDALEKNDLPIARPFSDPSLPAVRETAASLREKYRDFILFGIGGSSLGFRAIEQTLKGPFHHRQALAHDEPRVLVLDNVDPVMAEQVGAFLDPRTTGLIYISKSGSTPESAANFLHFLDRYAKAGGSQEDIVIICAPGDNGINRIAKRLGCHTFHMPPDLPGRYSVLSPVGFLPAELIGIDSRQLLAGARATHQAILDTPAGQNPVLLLGSCLAELAAKGKSIHVLFSYGTSLAQFGLWFVQLWSESLGKKESTAGAIVNSGTTPLAALGATDQHSLLQLFKEGPNDKAYGFVTIDAFTADVRIAGGFPSEKEYSYFAGHTMGEQLKIEQLATEMSLVRAGRPCYRIVLRDISAHTLGALFYFMEVLVIFIARLWDVNPFDQPGVEEGKQMTYSLMGRQDYASLRGFYEKELASFEAQRILLSIRDRS
ncbi:glucose-6-phosphate isomerase [candidate division TA06 bacterium DG_24]|uniref:Glucose-6-phosphate isomerase n=3 Tax=Bacteria division TA06 TaxID=1156500 RepID=A0A0S8JJB7_UNCT6|nr:MAG: glucose-6-phosphate isomerase [candidate division TA06 bacterium DG_24]KPK68588.1 MAG: glucose-6-phosphate isomerase [candidate division TA06 bacterium SM23_40]KPL09768.1 MAG: glucose-6-phosphate isomerase [candidate division TA06 bacterium SM1_40]